MNLEKSAWSLCEPTPVGDSGFRRISIGISPDVVAGVWGDPFSAQLRRGRPGRSEAVEPCRELTTEAGTLGDGQRSLFRIRRGRVCADAGAVLRARGVPVRDGSRRGRGRGRNALQVALLVAADSRV